MVYYHLFTRAPDLIKGFLLNNGIKAYWFRDIVNFGDLITPLLLKHYGFTPIHTLPHKTSLVSTGSILEHLPEDYSGQILGSGFIYETSRMTFPKARVFAVRGELTRERLGVGHRDVALGDPGLLASRVLPQREKKRYVLGIVPHHIDAASPVLARIAGNYREEVIVIDVQQQPLEVFRLIDQCEHILSSSLHGLIVADSFGIPNGWLSVSNLTGGRFKFDDYYSSLKISNENPIELRGNESIGEMISMTTLKPVNNIIKLQNSIHALWLNLK